MNQERETVELVHPKGGRIAVIKDSQAEKDRRNTGWLTPDAYSKLPAKEIEKHQGQAAMGKPLPKPAPEPEAVAKKSTTPKKAEE